MILTLAFGSVLLVAALLSGIAQRTILSAAVIVLVAGFLLGDGVTGVITIHPDNSVVRTLAELALFSVLFIDGQRVALKDLTHAWRLPGRALMFATPLTFAIATVIAVVVVGLPLDQAMLLAAVLTPTDPVFASAIVDRPSVPRPLRRLLNVESGLNDGLVLPLVLILIAVNGGDEVDYWLLAGQLAAGVAIGVAVPVATSLVLRVRALRPSDTFAPLLLVAMAVVIFATSQLTGANLYLAAFSAGITIATVMPELGESFRALGEMMSVALKLAAVLVVGALITPDLLAHVPVSGYVFAVLLLVVARPLAVVGALIRSGLPRDEQLTAGWFGPKGFASVIYGLLVLESGVDNASGLFSMIIVAIALSVVVHSSTDVPIAHHFARQDARTPT